VLLCLESVNTEIPEEIVKLNSTNIIPDVILFKRTLTLDGTWCIFVMDIIVFILLIPRS
jgi:hypothetical protein